MLPSCCDKAKRATHICATKQGRVSIAHFCYKVKNKNRKNKENMKDNDDYEFVVRNGA
jgi:hypothetical protein